MMECPYCESVFSSDGSFRVHKHRYHAGLEYRRPTPIEEDTPPTDPITPPIPTQEPPISRPNTPVTIVQVQSEFKDNPMVDDDKGLKKDLKNELKTKPQDWDESIGWVIGIGAVVGAVILAFLGKR